MVAIFVPLGAERRRTLPLPFDEESGLVLCVVNLSACCRLIHHIGHAQVACRTVLLRVWILLERRHGPQVDDVLLTLRDSLLLATVELGLLDGSTRLDGQVLTL